MTPVARFAHRDQLMATYREVLRAIAELQALRAGALQKSSNSIRARELRDSAWALQKSAHEALKPGLVSGAEVATEAFVRALKIESRLNLMGDQAAQGDPRYEELKGRLVQLSKDFVKDRRR
jgi:hypothetical protein